MQKNIAGQKWVVFAFSRIDNAPVIGDADQITANLRIDGGTADAIDSTNPTELGDGYYVFDLTQAESDGNYILISPVSSTSNVQVLGCPAALYTKPPNFNTLGIEADGDITKVNALDGHTAQSGDAYAIASDGTYGNAALKTLIDAILDDTNSTIPGLITDLANLTVSDIIAGITDGSYDLQEMVRIGFAILAGIGSGGGTSTVTYKDPTGIKDRIVATVDENGNRTPISYDGS